MMNFKLTRNFSSFAKWNMHIYIFHHLLSMLSISIKKEKRKDSMLSIYLSFPLDIYISGL